MRYMYMSVITSIFGFYGYRDMMKIFIIKIADEFVPSPYVIYNKCP